MDTPSCTHTHTCIYRQWLLRKMKLAAIHIRKAEGSHGQRRQVALEGYYGPPYGYTELSLSGQFGGSARIFSISSALDFHTACFS